MDVELKTFEEGLKKKKAEGLRLYSEFLQRWGELRPGCLKAGQQRSGQVRIAQNVLL